MLEIAAKDIDEEHLFPKNSSTLPPCSKDDYSTPAQGLWVNDILIFNKKFSVQNDRQRQVPKFRAEDCSLTCYPGHMGRVGSGEPVGADTVVEAQGIKAYLECTHVEGSVWAPVILGAAGLGVRRKKDILNRAP